MKDFIESSVGLTRSAITRRALWSKMSRWTGVIVRRIRKVKV